MYSESIFSVRFLSRFRVQLNKTGYVSMIADEESKTLIDDAPWGI
jgi:hypothetical protein